MKKMQIGSTELTLPVISVGCMRLKELDEKGAEQFVRAALELGANFFDHADIYGGGACEEIFAKAIGMSSAVRETVFLQSKCGIRKGLYDFSKEHILKSVEGILSRLGTDYLDLLLLHRPDALVEPEEVAEAFEVLHSSGKVRYFGVSNHSPAQIELLQSAVRQPLVVNQLQYSIANCGMVSRGLHVNTAEDSAADRTGDALEYCRLKKITVQAWSPFQKGMFGGAFLGDPEYAELNAVLGRIAEKYGITPTGMAIAWILRHPAGIQPVTGTTKPERLREICAAADIHISREEWYEIYRAAGNTLP